jgi:hypothetical protein
MQQKNNAYTLAIDLGTSGPIKPTSEYRDHYHRMFEEFKNIYHNNREMYYRLNADPDHIGGEI